MAYPINNYDGASPVEKERSIKAKEIGIKKIKRNSL